LSVAVVPAVEVKDPICPSVVEHRLETALHEETREVLHHYNYLYYQFDVPAGKIWARSYLDEIERASLFLPRGTKIEDADAERVLGYLKLRFRQIDMLETDGYVTIWPARTQKRT
jgi:hypothetical protein